MSKSLQSAFTIVEMLVVMLIIITLMSISLGAWMSTSEQSGRIASQQLLVSLIQQARNKSVSSAEPVTLRINKDDGTIMGIHKRYVWHQNDCWDIARDFVIKPVENTGQELMHKADDGFAMRCIVNAPPATGSTEYIIPLMLITNTGAEPWIDPSNTDIVAGVELWRVPQFLFHDGDSHKVADTWATVAWIGKRPNYPSMPAKLSSWTGYINADDFVGEWSYFDKNDSAISSIDSNRFGYKPYCGDRWTDIEIVFDGTYLYAFRDGQKIIVVDNIPTTQKPSPGIAYDIHIAAHLRGSGKDEILSVANIDDVAIMRVGSGDEEILPAGIKPKTTYKIICNKGTVNCFEEDESAPGVFNQTDTMVFVDEEFEADSFEISLGSDGSVLENKIYTAQEISAED